VDVSLDPVDHRFAHVIAVDVVLVSMPFAEVQRPSIALGLLRASLAGTDLTSQVVYANFLFAEAIGLVSYQALQSTPNDHLLGEWCFAGSLFPEDTSKDEKYLDMVLEVRCTGFPADVRQRKDLIRWVRAQSGTKQFHREFRIAESRFTQCVRDSGLLELRIGNSGIR